jgi:DNA-binding NarL/FixJ family response regulator
LEEIRSEESVAVSQELEISMQPDLLIEEAFFSPGQQEILTSREKQILTLILEGKTNKEIARALCRVERTIEYHRNNIMHKLQAHNITVLLKKAIAMGLVSL